MSNQIVKIDAAQFGIEESKAKEIAAQFQPMLDKMVQLEEEFNAIVEKANVEIDSAVVGEAKALRMKYVKIRTGTAEIHKKQKAFYLAGGRFVDGWKNAQEFASQGIESRLEAIEKHFENIEKQRIANLQLERFEQLQPYGIDATHLNLGTMPDEVWENFLSGTIVNYNARIEAERKAEEDRQAAIKAEQERTEAQRIENEKLKQQLADQQRIADEAAAELKARQDAEAADRKAAEQAAREAASAPDKIKLDDLAERIKSFQLPEMATEDGAAIIRDVQVLLGKVYSHIKTKASRI
jgi:hypothetical protein